MRLNHALGRAIAADESGGSDRSDRKYRTESWEFILADGAVYAPLDFSFTPECEDGSAVPLPDGTPGGGGPALRRQLAILKAFIEGFDFVRMAPQEVAVRDAGPLGGEALPRSGATARMLAEPGKAYAVYVNAGTRSELVLELPAGAFTAEWVDPKTGRVEASERFAHAGGSRTLGSPAYSEDMALRVRLST